MLFRKLTFYSLCQTNSILVSATRLTSNVTYKDLKMSLQTAGAPLTVRNVSVPVGGSVAKVGYADFGSSDGAVCLALHGSPGSITDTLELAPSLTEAGFRLVIPEFPGYGNTELEDDSAFDQSNLARTELVQNFLTAININRVAALVGHSLGSLAVLRLAANTSICQSVVFLNGVGLRPHRGIRPFWAFHTLAWLLQNSYTETLASHLINFGYAYRGLNVSSRAAMKTGILTNAKIDFESIHDNTERLRAKRLPLLSALTQKDPLVEWELPVEMAQHCGASEQQITFFDENEEIVSGPSIADVTAGYPRVLVFARGGHFVHRSHTDIVTNCIVQLIKHVSHDDGANAESHQKSSL